MAKSVKRDEKFILWFDEIGIQDVPVVGGKNASLGEMISSLSGAGVSVPGGFATTAEAFREFLSSANLDARIAERLQNLDVEDVTALAAAGEDILAVGTSEQNPQRLGELTIVV